MSTQFKYKYIQFSWIIHKNKFYEKDNELNEIHFPVQLGSWRQIKIPSENSDTSDFNAYVHICIYVLPSMGFQIFLYRHLKLS